MTELNALVAVRDTEWQEAIGRYLQNHHCRVTVTTDGLQTLAQARSRFFDIILVDDFLTGAKATEVTLNLKDISPESTVVVLGENMGRWKRIWDYCRIFAAVPYSQCLNTTQAAIEAWILAQLTKECRV